MGVLWATWDASERNAVLPWEGRRVVQALDHRVQEFTELPRGGVGVHPGEKGVGAGGRGGPHCRGGGSLAEEAGEGTATGRVDGVGAARHRHTPEMGAHGGEETCARHVGERLGCGVEELYLRENGLEGVGGAREGVEATDVVHDCYFVKSTNNKKLKALVSRMFLFRTLRVETSSLVIRKLRRHQRPHYFLLQTRRQLWPAEEEMMIFFSKPS